MRRGYDEGGRPFRGQSERGGLRPRLRMDEDDPREREFRGNYRGGHRHERGGDAYSEEDREEAQDKRRENSGPYRGDLRNKIKPHQEYEQRRGKN